MAARVRIDDRGIAGLATTPGMTALRVQAAQRIAAAGRADAPVLSGDYKRGIRVQLIAGAVHVVASDFKSWWIERGTSRRPAQHILEHAVERNRV